MANEFIIREGFDSKFDVVISGSLNVYNITGSLTTSSYAITSSYTFNSISASFVNTIPTASYTLLANTASFATLGSFVSQYTTNYTSTKLNPAFNTGGNGIGYLTPLYYPFVNVQSALNNRQANTIYVTPLFINSNCTVTKIGIPCQRSAGTNTIRLGLYTNSNLMLPDTKLIDEVITPSTQRFFYESTLATPVSLQAGEIYWLASLICGIPAGAGTIFNDINYLSISWVASVWQNLPINRLINPLLGSETPVNQNAIRHISYYAFNTTSTASLQNTLPQTPGSYTVYSYGAKLTAGGNHTNAFVPPSIYVTYP
jgi:hypothetical protein